MGKKIQTPHISARDDDFAKTVLMPGDPLRARMIAQTMLTDARLINNIRGIQGYTGLWKGQNVSVMASGMGMPSIGIYSYELYRFFGVENIIRIGSAGGMQRRVKLRELIFAMSASTDSAYAGQFGLPGTIAPTASYALLEAAVRAARSRSIPYHVGNILSSDRFYTDDPEENARWQKMGVLAVEMETAALYLNAARAGKRALSICTISDHLLTGEQTSAAERQNSFTEMIQLALDLAVSVK